LHFSSAVCFPLFACARYEEVWSSSIWALLDFPLFAHFVSSRVRSSGSSRFMLSKHRFLIFVLHLSLSISRRVPRSVRNFPSSGLGPSLGRALPLLPLSPLAMSACCSWCSHHRLIPSSLLRSKSSHLLNFYLTDSRFWSGAFPAGSDSARSCSCALSSRCSFFISSRRRLSRFYNTLFGPSRSVSGARSPKRACRFSFYHASSCPACAFRFPR
jgi:hypothetical protein